MTRGPRGVRPSAKMGVRDITSGVVPLVAWAAGGRTTLGWVPVAAAGLILALG